MLGIGGGTGFGFVVLVVILVIIWAVKPQRYQDADALYAFKGRGFGGEVGLRFS